MKRSTPVWLGAIATASLLLVANPAVASSGYPDSGPDPDTPPEVETIYEGFVAPLKLALDPSGAVWVTDNFAGTLNAVSPEGELTVAYAASAGTEVGAVSTSDDATYFAERIGTLDSVTSATVLTLAEDGEATVLADVLAYETAENPDADQHYGFSDLDADCEAQLPPEPPLSYTGVVDSHPYATLPAGDALLVADAGANAIFSVSLDDGEISTVAVLPPQPAEVGDWATGLGLPECTIGHTYDFEPVPTDLAFGPDGELYVTLLPGGPEDPSAGARGSVVRVDTDSDGGHGDPCEKWSDDDARADGESEDPVVTIETVVSDLAGATGLTVSPDGDIYVAEMFGNRISVTEAGESTAETFREVNAPAAVEWSEDGVYATVDALPPLGPPTPPTEPGGSPQDPAPEVPDPAAPAGDPQAAPTDPGTPPVDPEQPPAAGKLVFFPF